MSLEKIAISEKSLQALRPTKTFRDHKDGALVSSIDFDDSGTYCLTSAEDEAIVQYNARSGKQVMRIKSEKYGARLARFTHNAKNCVYASSKGNDTIRYLSLHDNKFIKYFSGHTAQVTCLEVAPLEDLLISTSLDNTVKLWDLAGPPSPLASLSIPAPSIAAFDSACVVFAVASQPTRSVSIYNLKAYEMPPFLKFDVDLAPNVAWTGLEFSNHGKYILLATDSKEHHVYDAYKGTLLARLDLSPSSPLQRALEYPSALRPAAFTIDGRYVAGGAVSESGTSELCVWDLAAVDTPGAPLAPFSRLPNSQGLGSIVMFNPKLMVLATAHRELTLWIPEMTETAKDQPKEVKN